MRSNPHKLWRAAALAAVFAVAPILPGNLRAQTPGGPDTSSSTTEDSTGKVTSIVPLLSITVDSRRGPFTYRLAPDLYIAGSNGRSMKLEQVQVGQRVTVYYYLRNGEETVARIVVLKTAGKPDK